MQKDREVSNIDLHFMYILLKCLDQIGILELTTLYDVLLATMTLYQSTKVRVPTESQW